MKKYLFITGIVCSAIFMAGIVGCDDVSAAFVTGGNCTENVGNGAEDLNQLAPHDNGYGGKTFFDCVVVNGNNGNSTFYINLRRKGYCATAGNCEQIGNFSCIDQGMGYWYLKIARNDNVQISPGAPSGTTQDPA